MAKNAITKVIYKPDSQSTDEYIVIVNPEQEMGSKGPVNNCAISVTDVVDSFQIFHSGQGAQGILGQASKQQLDTVFGTHNNVDCITTVLREGTAQLSGDLSSASPSTINYSRGSADTKGGRNT